MICNVCGKDISHIKSVVNDDDGVVRHATCNRTVTPIMVKAEVIARNIEDKNKANKTTYKSFAEELDKVEKGK